MADEPNIYQEYGEERARGDQMHGINADLLKALEQIERIASRGDVNTQPLLAPILDTARAAIAKAKADAAGGE